MNYYEELGIRPEATASEIRQAYRVAARLLHPDGHVDELVRAMAERQMKRLNEILAVLTDGQRRYEYDLGLESAACLLASNPATPGPAAANSGLRRERQVPHLNVQPQSWRARAPKWAQATVRHGFWILLATVMLGVALWYGSEGMASTPSTPAQTERPRPDEKLSAGPKSPSAPKPNADRVLRSELQPTVKAPAEKQAEGIEIPLPVNVPPHETTRPLEVPRLPDAAQEPSYTPAVAAKPEPSHSAPVRNPPTAASFAGNWLYMPGTEDPAPGIYPATYVEVLLAEGNGEISGSYRAQYKVRDLAVSPHISFSMLGKMPGGKSATLTWTSPDGAAGEVEMTLLGPDLMNLTWWTTRLGRNPVLGSGTTKLIRRQQP